MARLRRRTREQPLALADDIYRLIVTAPDRSIDVEEQVWRRERGDLILQALNELPPEQRRVLVLAYFGELSQSTIATSLGWPLGTVKKRVRLGLQKLRQALGPRDIAAPGQWQRSIGRADGSSPATRSGTGRRWTIDESMDLLEAYALGMLEPDERARRRAPSRRAARTAAAWPTISRSPPLSLPLALAAASTQRPPADLKDRVLRAAHGFSSDPNRWRRGIRSDCGAPESRRLATSTSAMGPGTLAWTSGTMARRGCGRAPGRPRPVPCLGRPPERGPGPGARFARARRRPFHAATGDRSRGGRRR